MILTLEVTAPLAAQLGAASRKTFLAAGGTIGRDRNCDWVLPHTKVSGRHARITCVGDVFYVEDSSRNGVFLNSMDNRLVLGRPYPLKSGDRLLIEPYEIEVDISAGMDDVRTQSPAGPYGRLSNERDFNPPRPFDREDPFDPHPSPPPADSRPMPNFDAISSALPSDELDPLKLLDPVPKRPTPINAPRARDLDRNSPLEAHYSPPAVKPSPLPTPPARVPPPGGLIIPEDYDPLAPDPPPVMPPTPPPFSPPVPVRVSVPEPAPTPLPREPEFAAPWTPPPLPPPPPVPEPPPVYVPPSVPDSPDSLTLPPRRIPTPPPVEQRPASTDSGLAAMLVGAGLEGVPVTPELAENFGRILRIVVEGVMDVLRARHQIKDEFRMQVTRFKPADNNPLKFSANVDDALHNLLVKKNEAYLDSVEAFEDAFEDLRNHQIALLAGMRVAFESMLGEFDPDHLQESFDRQIKRGALLGMPAKLRYWDLYRDKCQELTKDPETGFKKLFGEAFAKAYEDQLRLLKNRRDDDGKR